MNELQVFNNSEFGEIRMAEVGEKPYAVGVDVARALGYAKPSQAVIDHCKGIRKLGIPSRNQHGAEVVQETNCIPEGNIYRLIVKAADQSKSETVREKAEHFERWIFDEVLPSIRKTGSYTAKPMTDYQQRTAETRAENVRIRKAQILERLASQYEGTYRQILHAHATKELTGEYLLPLPKLEAKTYSAREIGDRLGISANMVGVLTNRHGLKTSEYGAWFNDKARGHAKEVQSFRYYDTVIPVLQMLADGEKRKA